MALIPEIISHTQALEKWRVEIVVVDDNSPDGTASALRALYGARIRVIVRRHKRGLGTAIGEGVNAAKGDIILGMDADGNHDPRVIPRILDALSDSDMAVGSRFVQGGGMADTLRYVGSLVFNACLHFVFGFPIMDNTSGMYAIEKKKLHALGMHAIYYGYGDYHLRLVWRAKAQGFRIAEVPVFYQHRKHGQSKSRLPIMLITYTHAALRLRLGIDA